MIIRALATAIVLAMLASPVSADEVQDLMAKFDVDYYLNLDLPEAQLKLARKARADAEALYVAGNPEEAEKLLKRAMDILTQCRC
jgi:hypothetical protein